MSHKGLPPSIPEQIVGAQTFTQFPLLPLELRLKVWGYTIFPRRHIWNFEDDWPASDSLSSFNPAINATQEARQAILKEYIWCTDDPGMPDYGVHINFTVDTLCLQHGLMQLERLLETRNSILDGLRWLELAPSDCCDLDELRKVRDIASLEVITVVVREDVWSFDSDWEGLGIIGNGDDDEEDVSDLSYIPPWVHWAGFTIERIVHALDLGLDVSIEDEDSVQNDGVEGKSKVKLAVVLAPAFVGLGGGSLVPRLLGAQKEFCLVEMDDKLLGFVEETLPKGDGEEARSQGWFVRQVLRVEEGIILQD